MRARLSLWKLARCVYAVCCLSATICHTHWCHTHTRTQTDNRAGKQAGNHTRIQWHYWWPATVLKSCRAKATGGARRQAIGDSRQTTGNWQQLSNCQLLLVSVLKRHNCEFKRCSLRLPRRLLINSPAADKVDHCLPWLPSLCWHFCSPPPSLPRTQSLAKELSVWQKFTASHTAKSALKVLSIELVSCLWQYLEMSSVWNFKWWSIGPNRNLSDKRICVSFSGCWSIVLNHR